MVTPSARGTHGEMLLLDPGTEADWWNWEALRKGCFLGAGLWEWLEEGEMMKGGETSGDDQTTEETQLCLGAMQSGGRAR